jgi:hypothetical protein
MNELKSRGLKDMLLAAVAGLKGIAGASTAPAKRIFSVPALKNGPALPQACLRGNARYGFLCIDTNNLM